ncbi:MAG: TatD family hydrolase [Flavobacteriales bacterium]|nr:TatD family hydrolase [Flavobacteriales bacterium]
MYINVHSHIQESGKNNLVIKNVFVQSDEAIDGYFSMGLHPWHISHDTSSIYRLKLELGNPKLLALGEIGLDKNVSISIDKQLDVLKLQLSYSENYKLPVILHIVKAYSEILELRKGKRYTQAWIVHGFVKKIELANQLIDKGFFISFGTALFNDNSSSINTFKKIDLTKVFLETDDNKDFSIDDLYKRAAEIRRISIEYLSAQIEDNFKKVFTRYNG